MKKAGIMKRVSRFTLVMVIAAMVVVIFFLISDLSFARGYQQRGGGGGTHGGSHQGYYQGGHPGGGHNAGRFWGGAVAGAIVAPLFFLPRVYPTCYDRVVRQGYYAQDYYGRTILVPPVIRRECY